MLTMSKRAVAKLMATSDAAAISQVQYLQVVLLSWMLLSKNTLKKKMLKNKRLLSWKALVGGAQVNVIKDDNQ